jgi:3-dehydroquinate synthase (EC 4.2.3.4)
MKQLQINIPGHDYSLFIERGLINKSAELISANNRFKKAVIITDSNVNKLYGNIVMRSFQNIGCEVSIIELQPGEESKSLENLELIYNKLLDFTANRDTILIALGGGVIGDITGFAASTFLRGIRYVQIPTSVIAQVDSSIGGKVAVNLKRGKNLVGSFYHPSAVIIDPDVLNTLEEKFFSDGMAEVIKYGLIRDAKLFRNLEQYKDRINIMENIEYIIETCCSIKRI